MILETQLLKPLLAERKPRAANPQVVALCESGMFFANNKKWAEAEKEFNKALELDPDNVQTLLAKAWMKLEHNEDQPDQAGTEALKVAEDYATQALLLMGKNLTEHGGIILRTPIGGALEIQGVALMRLNRLPEAIAAMKRGLELDPRVYHNWSNLGTTYVMMKDLVNAERCLREGAKLAGSEQDKWHAAAWRNLATFELFQHKSEAAEHIGKALEAYDKDVLAWVIQTRIWLELAAHLNVRKALDDAKYADRKGKSGDPRAKRVLALAHLRNNEFEDAVTGARAAIALKDMPTVNHLVIAVAEAKRGQVASAKEALAAAEASWPKELRETGGFIASSETGDLWIESADDLIRLKDEAEAAIAASQG